MFSFLRNSLIQSSKYMLEWQTFKRPSNSMTIINLSPYLVVIFLRVIVWYVPILRLHNDIISLSEYFSVYSSSALSYHLSTRSLFCLFLSGRFT